MIFRFCLILNLAFSASIFASDSIPRLISACESTILETSAQVLDSPVTGVEVANFAHHLNIVATACPELVELLASSPESLLLAKTNTYSWTVADLRGLLKLQDTYRSADPLPGIELISLQPVLKALPRYQTKSLSLWERFLRWIKNQFGDSTGTLPEWFKNFSISPEIFKWIFYIAISLTIIGAILVIVIEVNLAHRARRRAVSPDTWTLKVSPETPQSTLSDLRHLPLRERPGALLRIIASRLQQVGILSCTSVLTAREIDSEVKQLVLAQPLSKITRAAELATFGNWQPSEMDLEELVQDGNGLLKTLDSLGDEV